MSLQKKEEGLCGFGSCTPKCMQPCANIKVFGVFYAFNFLVTIAVGIFLSSQITSIEKQFNLSSEESGIISSTNDIGFVLTVLIFSFYGRRTHIPVLLGISSVLFGISGLLAAIPYFLYPVEEIPLTLNATRVFKANDAICTLRHASSLNNSLSSVTESPSLIELKEKPNKIAMLIICLGMALQGVGKGPRTSLAVTYIDDSLEKTKIGIFMGLISGTAIFGPAIAFIVGAQFSYMYVNLKKTDITPQDPRWIGAWWLGFLIFGGCAIVASLPMFFFPKRMKDRRVDIKQEKHRAKGQYVKEFIVLCKKLAKKPIYILLCLKSLVVIFVMAGSFPFVAKFMETQFQIPAWQSNMFIGAFSIVIAALGTVTGGYLTYYFKMTPMACLKLTTIMSMLSCIFPVLAYMLGCEQPVIVKPGQTSGLFASPPSNCSKSCLCTDDMFQPICGADGMNYYSPCHAGCTAMFNGTYTGCSCVQNMTTTAMPTYCPTKCTNLWPALIVGLVGAFIQCLTIIPDYILLLRSISEEEKPFALGMQSFLLSLLGFIPGPIVFGKIVDSSCLKWKSSTQKGGMCMLYDLHDFRLKFSVARFIGSVAIALVFLGVCYFARHKKDWQTNEDIPEIHFKAEEEKVFLEKNGTIEKNDSVA